MVHQAHVSAEDAPFPDVTLFRSLAGSLLYLTLTCQRSSPVSVPLCTGSPGDAAVTTSFSPAATQFDASTGFFSFELESPKDVNGLKLILAFDKGSTTQPSQPSMSSTVSKVLTTSAALGKECDDSSARVKKESRE